MYCQCGCGKEVNKKKFVYGHRTLWVKKFHNRLLCQCGCGNFINIQLHHATKLEYCGIPRFIHGHHLNTLEYKSKIINYNKEHLGELSNRWVRDRKKVRYGRKQGWQVWQRKEIYVRDKGICQFCGKFCLLNVGNQDPLKAHIDHIVSVKDSGTKDYTNGQVLCLVCHRLKHSAKANRPNSVKPVTGYAVGNTEPSTRFEVSNLEACVETMGSARKG